MIFDGSTVAEGDTIFHATYGAGTVSRAASNSATVRFGSTSLELPQDGKQGDVKVWFWQPRIILSPAKPEQGQFQKYSELVVAAHKAIFGV